MIFYTWKIFLLIFTLISATGLGYCFLIGINYKSKIKTILAITLGFGLYSNIIIVLGLLEFLNNTTISIIMLCFFIFGIYIYLKKEHRSLRKTYYLAINFSSNKNVLYITLFILLIILLFQNFLESFAPPTLGDDIKYHFTLPKRYLSDGSLNFYPDMLISLIPQQIEMLWLIAICLDSAELAQMINYSFSLIILGWIYILGKQNNLREIDILIAMILFYSITAVSSISSSGNIELGATLFFISGFYMLINFFNELYWHDLIISGILFGMYAATKLPFIAMVLILLPFIIVKLKNKKRTIIFSFKTGVVFYASVFTFCSFWYFWSFYHTGNPVYPFLIKYFGGFELNWSGLVDSEIKSFDYAFSHLKRLPKEYLVHLWHLIIKPQVHANGHINPLFIALIPFLFIKSIRKQEGLIQILQVSFLFYIVWVSLYPQIRIALPMFAILTIPLAKTIFYLSKSIKKIKYVFNSFLISFCLIVILNNSRDFANKIPYLVGKDTIHDFYNKQSIASTYGLQSYNAIKFMNSNLPIGSRVLLWPNTGFLLDHEFINCIDFLLIMADHEKVFKANEVIEELGKYNITHVAMNDNYIRKKLKTTLEESGSLNVIYNDEHVTVCSIKNSQQ